MASPGPRLARGTSRNVSACPATTYAIPANKRSRPRMAYSGATNATLERLWTWHGSCLRARSMQAAGPEHGSARHLHFARLSAFCNSPYHQDTTLRQP